MPSILGEPATGSIEAQRSFREKSISRPKETTPLACGSSTRYRSKKSRDYRRSRAPTTTTRTSTCDCQKIYLVTCWTTILSYARDNPSSLFFLARFWRAGKFRSTFESCGTHQSDATSCFLIDYLAPLWWSRVEWSSTTHTCSLQCWLWTHRYFLYHRFSNRYA